MLYLKKFIDTKTHRKKTNQAFINLEKKKNEQLKKDIEYLCNIEDQELLFQMQNIKLWGRTFL